MKFIINTTNLQSGGALQVASSLLEEWNKNSIHVFHVFLSPQLAALIEQEKFSAHFHFYEFNQNPTNSIWSLFHFHKKLNRQAQGIKPDAVFTIFGPALWTPQSPHLTGFANGYYLFDESDYIQNDVLGKLTKKNYYQFRRYLLFKQLSKEAQCYWVETEKAQAKLASTINRTISDIKVIGNTFGASLEATKNTANNKAFRLLYLSAYYGHKNFEIIPKVMEVMKQKNIPVQFLLTLTPEKFNQLFNQEWHKNYVINLGPIQPNKIKEVYEQSDAVFMPSLLETFSANYPEAMKMELPIICSDFDFSRNICGDAALYFDPHNPEDIAYKIVKLINDKTLQNDLINAGQKRLAQLETPESRANKLLTLIENIALENPKQ